MAQIASKDSYFKSKKSCPQASMQYLGGSGYSQGKFISAVGVENFNRLNTTSGNCGCESYGVGSANNTYVMDTRKYIKKLEQQNDFGTGLTTKPDKPRPRPPKNKDF
jgi:hypothetical protein